MVGLERPTQKKMMANPYCCQTELDELGPDDSIIDFAFISEEKFVLVILLASNGELNFAYAFRLPSSHSFLFRLGDVQAYSEIGSEKPRWSLTNIRSLCGRPVEPTTICIGPEAAFVVFGLSNGDLLITPVKLLLDVSWGSGQWISESNSVLISLPIVHDICLTMPTCSRCFITQNPPRPVVVTANKGGKILLVDLASRKCVAELSAPESIHNLEVITMKDSIDLLVTSFTGAQWIIPLENGGRGFTEVLSSCIPSEFNKVPPETWLVNYTDNVLFAVSNQTELRSAVHFGMSSIRLEFSLVKGASDWHVLGFVPLADCPGLLPTCFVVNERGLVRISQDPKSSSECVAAEFLFRVPLFSLSVSSQVADALHIRTAKLNRSILSSLLLSRNRRQLSEDLKHILSMAKTLKVNMENLIELFSSCRQEDLLLPEVRTPLYESVEYMPFYFSFYLQFYCLYLFCLCPNMCYMISLKIVSCACQQDWAVLTDGEVSRLINLLCEWQKDFSATSYHEICLRLANQYSEKFPNPCTLLYLISAMYIISDNSDKQSSASRQSIGCGLNSSVAITCDDRLMVWGDLTNQYNKPLELPDISIRSSRRSSSMDSPSTSPKHNRLSQVQLPRSVYMCGRPHSVCCGTEHVLTLTRSGQIWSWGGNRYGQCGVGHCQNVAEPEVLEGSWPEVRALSAGQFHSALLGEDGSVWTWGWGLYGQLGHGGRSISDRFRPTKVVGLSEPISAISCGRVHTILLSQSGQVLVTGGGAYGQLGTSDEIKKQYGFRTLQIEPGLKICRVATRFYHSVAVAEDGRIFEWGRNPQEIKMRMFVMRRLRSAQQKNSTETSVGTPPCNPAVPPLPMEVPRDDMGLREVPHLIDGRILELSTGLSHSAAITDQGSLFTWGKALEYQLGHGNKTERSEPHQVFEPPDVKWIHVECGGNHMIAVCSDGRTFGWGRNDFGQCGVPSDKTSGTPRKYFYQAKEGAAKRCVQLPDDSAFVIRPTLIPDVQVKIPQSSISSKISFMEGSVPMALVHLMAGNVKESIEQIGQARKRGADQGPGSALATLASLVWEVVANHEECQSKLLLSAAFRHLPMTVTQRHSTQLRHLWPNVWLRKKEVANSKLQNSYYATHIALASVNQVWDDEDVQRNLSTEEKLSILETWTAPIRPITSVEVPGAALRGSVARVRVWTTCCHVEPATVGVNGECSVCADEWTEKVRATLGAI
uniref:Nuclear pore complex protein Nup88 n=1 Tax=Heterorhabditis bacteriophora TaxID=37862 RepID=A0A1I7X7I8_HETBA